MVKIAIVDLLGLTYDGDTLQRRGLGGSESAVILMSKELVKAGFDVTVYNNCIDSQAQPGTYDGVKFIDHQQYEDNVYYDVVISSRSVHPFILNPYDKLCEKAQLKILWMHDTFCEGDQLIEDLLNRGIIDELFTLSDFHSTYVLNCDHGGKRNFEVLKHKVFQTRNGAVKHIENVIVKDKDPNHFVYNASVTKGLKPLLNYIWPEVKRHIPTARLTVIGGYYRFREGAEPDAQEKDLHEFEKSIDKQLDVTFTNVIPQYKIAEILSNATFMIYPTDFPETFGISSLESLLYKTPIITSRFGALEETAIDLACYKTNYASVPNGLFPNINADSQADIFVQSVLEAYHDQYLLQQKQNYCDVVNDIYGWDTVALQWKQHIYFKLEKYLHVDEYRKVCYINDKVKRIYGRRFDNEVERQVHKKFNTEKRIVIVSPFWNASRYIKHHCESIDQQDYNNYLHIVIDDCSDDDWESKVTPNPNRVVIKNDTKKCCIENQLLAFHNFVEDDDIVILLDGDDMLLSNNSIFNYYNELFHQGVKFTYGSCWSLADGIPLIAQDYPEDVKINKHYRKHLFNWKIPYTHLRTFSGDLTKHLNWDVFKKDGKYMTSGMDNPLFYELIELCEPNEIKAVKEITCFYNDLNPLNDYKINAVEQNENAFGTAYQDNNMNKKILIAIPTNAGIEPETFKSIYNLDVPDGYETHFEFFFGYQIDQIRNLIADWGKRFDYTFQVDSDIILPKDSLVKLINANVPIVSGMYIQRKHEQHTLEVYKDVGGGYTNIEIEELQPNSVMEVGAVGMGCCLMEQNVFLTMQYPHYVYQSALDHRHTFSEDVYFCKQARSIGIPVHVHTGVVCDHIGQNTFKVDMTRIGSPFKQLSMLDMLPEEYSLYLTNMWVDINDPTHPNQKHDFVVYDLGSNLLHWTRKFGNNYSTAAVYAVDATPSLEGLYQDELETGVIRDYHIGVLTDTDDRTVRFYMDMDNPAGNSYYKENTYHYPESKAMVIPGKTLNTIAKEKGWPKPDLIKLDTQGSELDILKGSSELLDECKDIFIEAQHELYNIGAPSVEDTHKFMESIGYYLVDVVYNGDVHNDYHYRKK